MALYTMNQLQTETQRTPQAIRKVFKNNEKIKALLPQHRIEKDNGRVYFDDAILEALKEYFGLSNFNPAVAVEVGGGIEDTENRENPQTNPPPASEEYKQPSAADEEKIAALEKQIEALEIRLKDEQAQHEKSKADLEQQLETERKGREAERADLEKQLQDKEAERRHFIGENAKLLNLLAAEQEEKGKLLLLMPPAGEAKKTVWSKFKGLFAREKEAAKSE